MTRRWKCTARDMRVTFGGREIRWRGAHRFPLTMMFTQSLVRYRTIQSCRTARWSHAASSICSRTRWNSTQAAPAV